MDDQYAGSIGPEQPPTNGPSGESGNAPKPDLVARMHEKRDEFAAFRSQYAQFQQGYNARLYEFLQFVYEMDANFRLDPEELRRFTRDEFFECNRQKPGETTLLWHLTYFLADARTDPERDKWYRPAAVLDHFRNQLVPVNEVAKRIKEGRGYKRIYKDLPGKRSEASASLDDLEVLSPTPERPDGQCLLQKGVVELIASPSELTPTKGPKGLALSPEPDFGGDPLEGGNNDYVECAIQSGGKVSGEFAPVLFDMKNEGPEGGNPAVRPPLRRSKSNTIFVDADPYQIASATALKRGVIFYETRMPVEGFVPIIAYDILAIETDDGSWPVLISRKEFARLHKLAEMSTIDGQSVQAAPPSVAQVGEQFDSDEAGDLLRPVGWDPTEGNVDQPLPNAGVQDRADTTGTSRQMHPARGGAMHEMQPASNLVSRIAAGIPAGTRARAGDGTSGLPAHSPAIGSVPPPLSPRVQKAESLATVPSATAGSSSRREEEGIPFVSRDDLDSAELIARAFRKSKLHKAGARRET